MMRLKHKEMQVPDILHILSEALHEHHAKAIIVGGSVRDHFLGLAVKDYDVEVYGLESVDTLEEILSKYGSVNLVGKSFGVLKFSYEGEEYDFSFPRREEKVAEGHRGFEVAVDAAMDFSEAARRRDFTINAMGYDLQERSFIDPFEGISDMEDHTLRHIDDQTFVEDPLRVYRAVQFCARFGYVLAEETFALCLGMVEMGMLEQLPKERVYTEFKKLLLRSPKPSIGFELMRRLDILQYFPELEALIGIPQSPKWHPEGDVWVHTLLCVDAMAKLQGAEEKQNLKYMFAVLCHDLGKATTTTIDEEGQIRAIGHEKAGVGLTISLMDRLTQDTTLRASLLPLVEHHLKPSQLYAGKAKDAAIRRLATKVNIAELVVVAKADFLGRTTEEAQRGIYHAGDWLLERSERLKVRNKPLDALLKGRDLIDLGLTPSPRFGEILERLYALQIEGEVTTHDEALAYAKREIIQRLPRY